MPFANPLVAQGTLNKVRGSVVFVDNPQLNVTASFLGDDGISVAPDGEASAYLPTMTGAVRSPNPFQVVTVTIHLLKSQGLSDTWKGQIEDTTNIGDMVVTPDSVTLGLYRYTNGIIMNTGDLNFAGKSPDFTVILRGTYNINNQMFDLQ